MSDQTLQTEFEFTLPRGYVDDDGTLHKEGRMRLATAADEIQPLQDPKVQSNQSYLTITLLGRVVTELGTLETVDRSVIENLFVTDLEHLQAMYERINNRGRNTVVTGCPECGHEFEADVMSGMPHTTEGGPDADADVDHSSPAVTGDGGGDGGPHDDTAFETAMTRDGADGADDGEDADSGGELTTGNPTE
ncbi:hypothetical protein [Halobiforma nitratireducens]|uniref:Phage tail assembly protein n=1 Tax=Halobiforma nitratireducens JCM 10879 TaxID=1227454 RepID=M0LRT4_9EURY|nr:hypothetical protein [Halobiforma nitratireducens]EMA35144.1 hypothetical protein C446_13349 [Halobiforma nitratireducens JCM 10879]